MSSLVIYILLWITFIHKQECAVIHIDHHKRVKDGIDYIMHKYLNPLRTLTADLPNHAIEMQIEIHETSQKPQKRVLRVANSRNPKKALMKRSQDETKESPGAPVAEPSTIASTATDVAPPSAAIAAESTAQPAAAPAAPSSDPSKVPVYMDDLKKIIDDLENRLRSTPEGTTTVTTTTIISRKQGGGEASCNNGGGGGGNGGGGGGNGGGGGGGNGGGGGGGNQLQTPVRSIQDIVQLLQKAIHIEHQMPKPDDNNLEWVQLKIPKNL
ncbi:aspartate, glycine, lysine and serine-rich protein isoform X2 [Helicoverpa armigera]|uniref:aspartate, glycine, lysine and serine-rich protein isoform X2 n=1 Tax=Helicoverpa armigera TaxID=29058 RepID=UPI0021136D0E|nr:aspartate, glycine, lysine and serine-rich protein isoform X2 [Helicoverpa armigera]